MSNANPVGWFEIPTTDISRAKTFYEKSLGMNLSLQEMQGWKMAWFPHMNSDKYGATGTLIEGEGYAPSHKGTLVYFSVDDIAQTLEKINRCGGKTLMEKKGIGEHGFIAMFEDSEGNRVALHSMK